MPTDPEVVVVQGGVPSKVVWQVELVVGIITLGLGIALAFHPSTSLSVVCVFIGILLILGGIFHFIRALDHEEQHRAWVAVAGLLEVVIGVVMIRHLDLTKAAIGLLIGIVWIVQGIVALMGGIMSGAKGVRGWAIAFGLISLIAGIVVVSVPSTSVNALATLLGIWFIVMGVFELIGGFVLRSQLKKLEPDGPVDVTSEEELAALVGRPVGRGGPSVAPDPVNQPMIRHWAAAFADHNPVYTDPEAAARSRFGEIVAPPLMLQTWTMPTPTLEGIAERGGSPVETDGETALAVLDRAGYVATLATNTEFEIVRYLRLGEVVSSTTVFESISEEKQTRMGRGRFVTWVTTYTVEPDEVVGRQTFRILKFDPSGAAP